MLLEAFRECQGSCLARQTPYGSTENQGWNKSITTTGTEAAKRADTLPTACHELHQDLMRPRRRSVERTKQLKRQYAAPIPGPLPGPHPDPDCPFRSGTIVTYRLMR